MDTAGKEHQPGEGTQCVSLAKLVAKLPPAFERLLLRLDRRVELIGHPALVGEALHQLGSPVKRQAVGESECPCVLRARLAMRTAARRLLGCLRRPSEHR